MKKTITPFIALTLLLHSGIVLAETSKNSLLDFEVNAIGVLQSGGSNSFSGELAWAPRIELTRYFGLRPLVGAMVLKDTFGSKFLAYEGQALASIRLGSFDIEAGGGYQIWSGQNVSSPLICGDISWNFSSKFLGLFNRFFVGYSKATLAAMDAQEAKLGFGIVF